MFNKFRANRKGTSVTDSPHSSLVYLSSPAPEKDCETVTALSQSPRLPSYRSSQAPVLPPIRRIASRQKKKKDDELGSPTFSTTLTAILDEIAADGSTSHHVGLTGLPEDDGTTEGMAFNDQAQMATSRSTSSPIVYPDPPLSPVPTMPTKFWVPQPSSSPRPSQSETPRFGHIETPRPSQADAPRSYSYNSRLTDVSSDMPSSSSAPKVSRARNLLHPKAILTRRRTAQGIEAIDESMHSHNLDKSFDVPAMNLPEDYDPRIIGKGVHDFSAPKTSTRDSGPSHAQSTAARAGLWEPPEFARRQSIPVLSVNRSALLNGTISIDQQAMLLQPDKRPSDGSAETLDDTSEVSTSTAHERGGSRSSPQESVRSRTHRPLISTDRTSDSTVVSMRISQDRSTLQSLRSIGTRSSSPPQSVQQHLREESGAALEPPNQPTRQPKHASSNASRYSRFSFQFDNDRSVEQERAMEAKYGSDATFKPKGKQALRGGLCVSATDSDVDYSDADDNLQEIHDYEEAVPGVNAERFEEDALCPTPSRFATALPSGLRASASGDFAKSSELVTKGNMKSSPQFHKPSRPSGRDDDYEGRTTYAHDDDMYFDDGNIMPIEIDASTSFDENLLDDMTSPAMTRYEKGRSAFAFARQDGRSGDDHLVPASTIDPYHRRDSHPTKSTNTSTPGVLDAYHNALASAANRAAADGKFHRVDSLGIDMPADDLTSQPSSPSMSLRQTSHALTAASADSQHAHSATGGFVNGPRTGWDHDDNDDFTFDDDSMIAAANAEALEADDAGFYGREFGFYGRAAGPGGNDAAAFAGGYFHPALQAADAARAKNVARDPNLTPITERSEYSRVNSFVALPHGILPNASATGGPLSTSVPREAGPPPTTPGLRELVARFGPDDEDDLTLGHLLKLRKGAFGAGGAQPAGRLGGLGGSPSLSSSPLGPKEVSQSSGHPQHDSSVAAAPSSASPATALTSSPPRTSKPSGVRSPATSTPSPSSARHTQPPSHSPSHISAGPIALPLPLPSPSQLSAFAARPPAPSTAPGTALPLSPVARRHHAQRTSSAATGGSVSVAYVREAASPDDEDSGQGQQQQQQQHQQWWLERRRTLPSGEVVVVGRERVEGGRI